MRPERSTRFLSRVRSPSHTHRTTHLRTLEVLLRSEVASAQVELDLSSLFPPGHVRGGLLARARAGPECGRQGERDRPPPIRDCGRDSAVCVDWQCRVRVGGDGACHGTVPEGSEGRGAVVVGTSRQPVRPSPLGSRGAGERGGAAALCCL